MSTTTKSPLCVVRNALAAGRDVFHPYAHRRCPKLYTQPQLFACLALKAFLKTDYRGIAQYLRDLPDLARAVGPGPRAALHHLTQGRRPAAPPAPRPPTARRHRAPVVPPPAAVAAPRLRLQRP